MKNNLILKRNFLFVLPVLLFLLLILLIQAPFFEKTDLVSFALTFDLLLSVPFVYYLIIRKRNIPKTTVVPVIIIGLVIGAYLLPIESQNYLNLFKTWILPLIELSVISYVIYKIRSGVRLHKSSTNATDFYTDVQNTLSEIVPKKAIPPVASEIALFYYAFVHWKKVKLKKNDFSYHKNSATQAILGAFLLIILVETFVIHLLLMDWSPVFTWILSILSIYSAFQVFGIARSISKRPIQLTADELHLKFGILSEVKLPLSQIEKIEHNTSDLPEDTIALSPLHAFEGQNLILHLNKEATLMRIYGFRKTFKKIALLIDEKEEFVAQLEAFISNNESK